MEQLANLSSGPFFVRLAGQSGFPRQVLFQTSKKEMPGNVFTPRWDPIRSTKISKLQYQYVFSHVRCNMVASEAGVLCYLCGGVIFQCMDATCFGLVLHRCAKMHMDRL
jgi:hypothetical protein